VQLPHRSRFTFNRNNPVNTRLWWCNPTVALTFDQSTSKLPSSSSAMAQRPPRWPAAATTGSPLSDPTTSRVSLTLSSSIESVDTIERAAKDFAQRSGFLPDTVHDIVAAVHEAAINALLHGNASSPSKRITASFETSSDCLIIRIADQGLGFDLSAIPDPLAPENLLRKSGRGIFLIRTFMDELHVRQLYPGTELTLIKHRAPAQPET
jgi:serine/threonine-protein kinase RsbW